MKTPERATPTSHLQFGRRGFLGMLGAIFAASRTSNASASSHGSPIGQLTEHERRSTKYEIIDPRPDWLRAWSDRPRIPVKEPKSVTASVMMIMSWQQKPIELYYHGGSKPGSKRAFTPDLVFHHENDDAEYVSGYCHRAKAPRILKLDMVELHEEDSEKHTLEDWDLV